MRSLGRLFLVITLCSTMLLKAQLTSKDLADKCLGYAMLFNEGWETLPKERIKVQMRNGSSIFIPAIIFFENKNDYSTIIMFKQNANKAVIMGFAPLIKNGILQNMGSFAICVRENGVPTIKDHFTAPLINFSIDNKFLQSLKGEHMTVTIQDRLFVVSFDYTASAISYYLPSDYSTR